MRHAPPPPPPPGMMLYQMQILSVENMIGVNSIPNENWEGANVPDFVLH